MAHTTQEELALKVTEAEKQVEVGGVYAHYKDSTKRYRVLNIGLIEDTEEVCVIYQAMYGEGKRLVWVRPLDVWLAKVETESGEVSRFQKI
jgi:hypothetical protein